jgi:Cupin-like domain
MTELPSLTNLTHASFLQASHAHSIPIVVTDEVNRWRAFHEWSTSRFADRFGQTPIKVIRLAGGVSRPDPNTGFQHLFETMSLRQFVDLTKSPSVSQATHYWNQPLMDGPFNSLIDDVIIPSIIAPKQLQAVNLWVGQIGCTTPLHFDLADNLFCQIKGSKSFCLFSPDDTQFLRPYGKSTKINYVSQIDPLIPDFELFPEFRQAKRLMVTVNPGDMLFLPVGWWHHVSSLSDSISVNFWYRPTYKDQRPIEAT